MSPSNTLTRSQKAVLHEAIDAQPDDANFEEILHESTFERRVERGLTDAHASHTVSHEDALKSIRSW